MTHDIEPFVEEDVDAILGAWQQRPVMPVHIVSSTARPTRQVEAEKASTMQWPIGTAVVQILQRQLNRARAEIWIPNSGLVSGSTILGQGAQTDPVAGTAIATILAANFVPGVSYVLTGSVYLDGTVTAADDDNMRLNYNGAAQGSLNVGFGTGTGGGNFPFGPITYTYQSGSLTVTAKANSSGAAAVYHAALEATPQSSSSVANLYLSPNIGQLQTAVPGGVLLNAEGQHLTWRSQRALYAIASLAGPTYVNVVDYLYDEN